MSSRVPSRPKGLGRSSRGPLTGAPRWWVALNEPRRRWLRLGLLVIGVPAALGLLVTMVLWVVYGHMIDRRLGGEQKPIPRIFGRPFELRPKQGLSPTQLEQRLNDV